MRSMVTWSKVKVWVQGLHELDTRLTFVVILNLVAQFWLNLFSPIDVGMLNINRIKWLTFRERNIIWWGFDVNRNYFRLVFTFPLIKKCDRTYMFIKFVYPQSNIFPSNMALYFTNDRILWSSMSLRIKQDKSTNLSPPEGINCSRGYVFSSSWHWRVGEERKTTKKIEAFIPRSWQDWSVGKLPLMAAICHSADGREFGKRRALLLLNSKLMSSARDHCTSPHRFP